MIDVNIDTPFVIFAVAYLAGIIGAATYANVGAVIVMWLERRRQHRESRVRALGQTFYDRNVVTWPKRRASR